MVRTVGGGPVADVGCGPEHVTTYLQVALAALLAASPVMLPIPGTGTLAHLEENVGAASVRLTAEDLASLAG